MIVQVNLYPHLKQEHIQAVKPQYDESILHLHHILMFSAAIRLRITLDTGSTGNMIQEAAAIRLGAKSSHSSQSARQADGFSPLQIGGETRLVFTRENKHFTFDGLVIRNLDVPISCEIMTTKSIILKDCTRYSYGSGKPSSPKNTPRPVYRATILPAPPSASTIWPGEFIEVDIPEASYCGDGDFALEPRRDRNHTQHTTNPPEWPLPDIVTSIFGHIRIHNPLSHPVTLKRNENFAQIQPVYIPDHLVHDHSNSVKAHYLQNSSDTDYSHDVSLDPDNIMPPDAKSEFQQLLTEFSYVFNTDIKGYNGASG